MCRLSVIDCKGISSLISVVFANCEFVGFTSLFISNFKSCLVCPERWGRPNQINNYKKKMKLLNFSPDAVMTSLKYSKKWLS